MNDKCNTSSKKHLPIFALIMLPLLLLALGSISVYAEKSVTLKLNSLFYEANRYYEEGNLVKSIETYEKICAVGYTSGNLYYNLANAYYRNGEKGLALLNYLRAKRLIPRDPDLRVNLEQVRSELELPEESLGFFQLLTIKLTDFLTVRELEVVASIFFTFLTVAIILWMYFSKWKRSIRIITIVIGLCLVVTLVGISISVLTERVDRALVVVKEAVVRFEPSETGATHYTLSEGSSAIIENSREGWIQVRRADGKKGWVKAEEIQALSF